MLKNEMPAAVQISPAYLAGGCSDAHHQEKYPLQPYQYLLNTEAEQQLAPD